MATDALTNRKMDAARSVLRQVGLGLPAPDPLLSPLGMASLSAGSAFPASTGAVGDRWGGRRGHGREDDGPPSPSRHHPYANPDCAPGQRRFYFPTNDARPRIRMRCFNAALPRFLSPTMPDDLAKQIAACKSRIANVRTVIGMMRAMGEPIAEAEQQLALELAFLRTLEDIRSEKESAAQDEEATAKSEARRRLQ